MESLHISNPESTHIMNQLSSDKLQTDSDPDAKKVRFDIPEIFHPRDFLSCFQFQPNLSENEPSRHRSINVADSITQEKKVGLGMNWFSVIFLIILIDMNITELKTIFELIGTCTCILTEMLAGRFIFSQCTNPDGSSDSLSTVIQNCNISPNLLKVSLLTNYFLVYV